MNWLDSITGKPERFVVGLISGTSMDGIDAALVKINGSGLDSKVELIDFITVPYEENVRNELECIEEVTLARLSDLNFIIGEAFAEATIKVVEKAGLKIDEVDLIGSHGQTVFHNPPSNSSRFSSTLQIGELDVIAERTGITTVGDFRTRDIACSGEGAPLVPYVDYLLFHDSEKVRIAQNIGGIANCTLVTKKFDDVVAFDTGPGNVLIDSIVKLATSGKEKFDKDGKLAFEGEVDKRLLHNLLSISYFKVTPPKSTGREIFGREMTEKLFGLVQSKTISLSDLLSTLVQFTVDTIVNSYEDFIFTDWDVSEVILSGGGAYNPVIFEGLKHRLNGKKLTVSDDYGFPADSKEAVAFAVFSNETVFGNNTNLPKVTGATSSSPLGKIVIGKNLQG